MSQLCLMPQDSKRKMWLRLTARKQSLRARKLFWHAWRPRKLANKQNKSVVRPSKYDGGETLGSQAA